MAAPVEHERRSGVGRRSSDSRLAVLEDYVHRQFTAGASLHARDHDHIREAEQDRRRLRITIAERVMWVAIVFLAVAAWESIKGAAR